MQRVPMMDSGDGQRRADNGARFKAVTAKTANYTVLTSDTGTCFSNKGAAGTVNFTLPTTPLVGNWYLFVVSAAQTLTVTAAGGAKINNSAANGNISAAGSQNGVAVAEVFFTGTNWHVILSGTWTTT